MTLSQIEAMQMAIHTLKKQVSVYGFLGNNEIIKHLENAIDSDDTKSASQSWDDGYKCGYSQAKDGK